MLIAALKYLPMDEAGEGEGGGGAPEGGAPSGEPSALASGGEEPTPLSESIPEKYRVFGGEDNSEFNLEASAQKLAEGYGNLTKKLGTDELPPDTPENYELDGSAISEDFDVESFMKDEQNQSFLKKAHALGMTNKQVQMVTEYALKEFAPQLQQGSADLDAQSAVDSLKADTWKSEGEYKENMNAANRAFMSLPEDMRDAIDGSLGNNPEFIKVMALFGKEMSEDVPPNDVTEQDTADIQSLMQSDAYKDSNHPEHKIVSDKVRAYFEKKSKTKAA